jgi:O-succinylbenzoate synthase
MKVEAVTIRELRMPLKYFFETSFGRSEGRRVLLVTAHCEGVEGWAECVAGDGPFFSYEWIETARATIRDFLAPALIGKSFAQAKDSPALMSRVRGHNMAKAAVENALWAAEARAKQQPLWKLLGGTLKEIACGVSIGIQNSHEQLLEKIETELAAGYQRIKVKVKPGWDVEVLAKIRQRWPKVLLSCDANSAYRPTDLDHLRKFDDFDLLMIEQPLWDDDIFQHSKLQKELKTAICLDESIRQARDAEVAIALGACRIINIKVGRLGGFTEAIAVHGPRSLPATSNPSVVRRHARNWHRTGTQHRAFDPAQLPSSRGCLRFETLLGRRHCRAGSRSFTAWNHRGERYPWHGL